MSEYMLFVYTRPVPGMEADYHRWYNEVHLPEVLRVPGFTHAQRLESCDPFLLASADRTQCLAIFTIVSEDIESTITEFHRARKLMATPPSLDLPSVSFQLLRVLASS